MNDKYEQYYCTFDVNGVSFETEFRLFLSGEFERHIVGGNSYELHYPLIDVYIMKKRRFTICLESLESKDNKEGLKSILLFLVPIYVERKLRDNSDFVTHNCSEQFDVLPVDPNINNNISAIKEHMAGETYQQRSEICYEDLLHNIIEIWRNPLEDKILYFNHLKDTSLKRRVYERKEWENAIHWAEGDEYIIIDKHKLSDNPRSRTMMISYIINSKKMRMLEEKLRSSELGLLPTIFGKIELNNPFSFIHDGGLRDSILRDCKEINAAAQSGSAKAVIILCGSVIEALLYDLLKINETNAQDEAKKLTATANDIFDKASSRPINEWGAYIMIKVAKKLFPDKLNDDAATYSDILRDYRNFIHPAKEERAKKQIDHYTAAIAISVVNLVIKGLK